jgi:hypothetical protein
LKKGPNLSSRDDETGQTVEIVQPSCRHLAGSLPVGMVHCLLARPLLAARP